MDHHNKASVLVGGQTHSRTALSSPGRSRALFLTSLFAILAVLVSVMNGPALPAVASDSQKKSDDKVKLYRYEVVDRYPHDAQAFTQGLIYHKGYLYESTGLNGKSSLRKVELKTGKVLKKVDLDAKYFGEGLTLFGGRLYQLTWLAGVGFIYDLDSFDKVGEFHYEGQGWGLTHDERSLILSDGTNKLKFMDPNGFKPQRSIEVFDQDRPLNQLNELELINGEIFSNVWHKDLIARIDPLSGRLRGIIDLSGLGSGLGLGPEDVLNGIAYLPKDDCLLVTGKRWPFLFKIRIITSSE